MASNRSSTVKPLKRYRKPRYPSHEEPDPTNHPYPVPYPYGKALLSAVASLGLAASGQALSEEGGGAGNKGNENKPKPPHPLTAGQSGLPYQPSPYGTGAPTPLDGKLARLVIERLFKEEGYHLKKNFQYRSKDVSFEATGYDPQNKVGYVLVSWDNMEGDAYEPWWMNRNSKGLARELERIENSLSPQEKKDLAAAKSISDPAKKEAALKNVIEKHGTKRISLTEARQVEKRAAVSHERFAIINCMDRRFQYEAWNTPPEVVAALEQAKKIADPAKRKMATDSINEKFARKQLKKLEQAVREYLAWARKQGR